MMGTHNSFNDSKATAFIIKRGQEPLMMETHNSFNDSEATTFIIKRGQQPLNSGKQRRERLKCNHYHQLGHTKDKCSDLHDRVEGAKLNTER